MFTPTYPCARCGKGASRRARARKQSAIAPSAQSKGPSVCGLSAEPSQLCKYPLSSHAPRPQHFAVSLLALSALPLFPLSLVVGLDSDLGEGEV